MLEIQCAPVFRQNGQVSIFGLEFAQNLILELEFQKSKSVIGISMPEILCAPIWRQNEQLLIFGHNFVPKAVLVKEFQKSKSRFEVGIWEI